MKEELAQVVATAVKDLFDVEIAVDLTRPDEQYGDYATNVALQLANKLGKSPREIAEQLADQLQNHVSVQAALVEGPGFINIHLREEALWQLAQAKSPQSLAGQTVVAEYSDPNPFKVLHAGHLYTSVVGDAIANLLQNAGANVHRVNFGGDVGLHVARTMWAILRELGGDNPEELSKVALDKRAEWMSQRYVDGNAAYEKDETAKAEIRELNKKIYQIHAESDHDSPLAQIYWTTRSWSYAYFDDFYARLGSKFEKYYPESEVADLGVQVVKQNLGKVFKESDGAIVFAGEEFDLHTRVFINSEGLPTYEAKDVGLIFQKYEDYKFDKSVVITGNDIEQYMQVILKAVEQIEPKLAKATTHLTHGMVKLPGGVKMSSRLGNIIGAEVILDLTTHAARALAGQNEQSVVLGAVKYSFLRQRLGGDIVYDPAESVSLEGNSGPYLQYAHARACSILAKAEKAPSQHNDLDAPERDLLRKIGEYAEVVEQATNDLAPHHICTYLYELAQSFNRFYEKSRIIGDPREAGRLKLVEAYSQVLKNGLNLLGIEAPEKM